MASHFQCVGFPLSPDVSTEEDVLALASRVCEVAAPASSREGFRAFRWFDGGAAGAHVVLAVDEAAGTAALQCFTPLFGSPSGHRVRVQRALPDAECPVCDFLQVLVIPEDGAEPYPLLLEWKEPGYTREDDLRGEEFPAAVALLAGRVRLFKDADAYAREAPADRAPHCFLATGLEDRPPRPKVELAGPVLRAEPLRNPVGGGHFHRVDVGAGGGAWTILLAAEDVPGGLTPGQWLLATATAVGWRMGA